MAPLHSSEHLALGFSVVEKLSRSSGCVLQSDRRDAFKAGEMVMQGVPLIGIVDDDPDIPAALGSFVRSLGYRAECFSSVEQLLARPLLNEFACIISDIHMPITTGLELVPLLKELGEDLPVILMTGRFEHGLFENAILSGARSVVAKPFIFNDLVLKLQDALQKE